MRIGRGWVGLMSVGIAALCGCTKSMTSDAGVDASTLRVCARASDCDAGASCIGGVCMVSVSCSSSRMCPGLVCDIARAICVECVGDSDCPTDARCRSGVCETVVMCDSDRDCSASDAVCDLAAGLCVECNADADCASARFCAADHSCPARVCVPLETTCIGMQIATCAANGSGFAGPLPCPSGACSDGACTPAMDASIEDGGPVADAGPDASMDPDAGPDASMDFDAGPDASTAADAGPDALTVADAGPDASMPAMWEEVPAGGGVLHSGYTDFSPPGATSFYASSSDTTPAFARFDTAGLGAWTSFASPSAAFGRPGYFAGPAWVGANLYLIAVGNVYRYEIAVDAWTTPLTSVATTDWAQNTHDDSGHVYAITMDDRVATYDIAGNTIGYQAFGMAAPAQGPRLAWDGTSRLLYIIPNIELSFLFSFDPTSGAIAVLAPLPESHATPTFCSDRAGHLYAAGDNTGTAMWRYEIATDTWTPLPPLPFDHDANGACTVTASGYLYVTDTGARLARLAL